VLRLVEDTDATINEVSSHEVAKPIAKKALHPLPLSLAAFATNPAGMAQTTSTASKVSK